MTVAAYLAGLAVVALFIMLWMDTRITQKERYTFQDGMQALSKAVTMARTWRIR